ALGMAVGLAQFVWTRHYLGNAGVAAAGEQPGAWKVVVAIAAAVALAAALVMAGVLKIDAVAMAAGASWAMLVLGVGYFVYLLFFAGLTAVERRRVLVMVALVAASVTFWAGYEQTAPPLNFFADRLAHRPGQAWRLP